MQKILYFLLIVFLTSGLSGCKSTHGSTNRASHAKERVRTSSKLGIDLNKKDYLPFFLTASEWLGVPYRSGGSSKKGVDCSGFVSCFYRDVFNISLSRNSRNMYEDDCAPIRKSKLQPGDLVFFTTGKSRKINHVGVYLKDNKFIHASTSKGVIVSDLNDPYYKNAWKKGGRVYN